MKSIVTHNGRAHRDDLLSVAVLACLYKQATVYRRRPTESDLEDPEVIVADAGGQYDPSLRNFDHHQFGSDTEYCTLSLIFEWLGVYDAAQAFLWMKPLELLDSVGPRAVEAHLKVDSFKEQLLPVLSSPTDEYLIREFSRSETIPPAYVEAKASRGASLRKQTLGQTEPYTLRQVLEGLGRYIIDEVIRIMNQLEALAEKARVCEAHGLQVLDMTEVQGAKIDSALAHWMRQRALSPDLVIANDMRSKNEFLLYRLPAAQEKLDLKRLEGHPAVTFVHRDGQFAKVKRSANALRLIKRTLLQRGVLLSAVLAACA